MTRVDRLAVSVRAYCLAGVLGLSFATRDTQAVQGTVLLLGVSAAAVAVSLAEARSTRWIAGFEGILVGLVIGVLLPEGLPLLPYLVVPAVVAGIGVGLRLVAAVITLETLALTSISALPEGSLISPSSLAVVGPWLLTGLGGGLLAAWLRQLRGQPHLENADPAYESAHRLLTQLRTVARRLSSGLDADAMATRLLNEVASMTGAARGALFVRTEGGILAPLAHYGDQPQSPIIAEASLVDLCWAEMEPQSTTTQQSGKATSYQAALPMRTGARMIGVLLLEGAALEREALDALMRKVDEQSIRIEAALAFDEVRSLATVEERRRLAREIHDGVAQEIASLGYLVDELSAFETRPEQLERISSLRNELTRLVQELRLSIFDLRSEVSSAGLGSALSDYVRDVGARSGITVHLSLDESPFRLRNEVETELFRIAQEAITNARKHARAANLWVSCETRPPFARIEVRDDGVGIEPRFPRLDSYGLKIMRERAARIDAVVEVNPKAQPPDQGTYIAVTVGADVFTPFQEDKNDDRRAHARPDRR